MQIDTTLMAESEEELKSLLTKVKEKSEKSWLKAQLLRSFTDRDLGTGVDEKRERERAVSLGLCGKPIKPMHRTCTAHEGTGHPLKEVLKAQARK